MPPKSNGLKDLLLQSLIDAACDAGMNILADVKGGGWKPAAPKKPKKPAKPKKTKGDK